MLTRVNYLGLTRANLPGLGWAFFLKLILAMKKNVAYIYFQRRDEEKRKMERKWSLVHLVDEAIYLVRAKNQKASEYAIANFKGFKKLDTGAYIIPASKISAYFTIVE